MKKTALWAGLLLAVAMPAAFSASETEAVSEAVEAAPVTAIAASVMDPAFGHWYKMGYIGSYVNIDSDVFIYPDKEVVIGEQSFPAEFTEDGSITLDVTGYEGSEGYTVTAEVSPVSEESLAEYEVEKDEYAWVQYSDASSQMIVTLTYPDPQNPLATSPKTTTVYFLKMTGQDDFLENFMCGKTWKIGSNLLAIDAEGKLNLNNGASTGSTYFFSNRDEGTAMDVEFSWDGGGYIKYLPTKVEAETIILQNKEDAADVLTLELDSELEAAPEAMTE